jgi:hypothetical protein
MYFLRVIVRDLAFKIFVRVRHYHRVIGGDNRCGERIEPRDRAGYLTGLFAPAISLRAFVLRNETAALSKPNSVSLL